MKTKLDYAHEYAMKHLENSKGNIAMTSLVSFAWDYADTMQSEADKRSITGTPEAILNGCNSTKLDWQPDWSQAPDGAVAWSVHDDNKTARWHFIDSICAYYKKAPLFGYKGNWQDSLRKRP